MNKLRNLLFTFSSVTTGSVIMATIFISIFYKDEQVTSDILWQILIVSAICCLGNFIYPQKKLSKYQLYALTFLHYIYIMGVVIGGGLYFEWIYINKFTMILAMFISVTIVFLIISFVTYTKAKKESQLINERLQEYQQKKNAS